MPLITVGDGAEILYKDWGSGKPVVFSHGWPLNSDSWEAQMLHLAGNGCRAVAHDRRGHGRSTQTWHGNDMDTYADDLATLLDTLDLREVTLVGFSTGGGEVARHIGRHGTGRVAKVALVSAVPATTTRWCRSRSAARRRRPGSPVPHSPSTRAPRTASPTHTKSGSAPTFSRSSTPERETP